MPKETERQVRTDTEYFTKDGVVYRKQTTYTVLSNAKITGELDNPTVEEFRDTILNKDEKSSKQGYISKKL